ncbi:MAG: DUF541 domain-containing protein [Dehalococcoidia bacterium]|nr:DUF541 domain-containing protein [Dehalococcoidia bacterium]
MTVRIARTRGGRALTVALLGGVALLAAACTSNTDVTLTSPEQTGVAVSGEGVVTVVPDVGTFTAGIEVTRPTVAAAREEAARAAAALTAAVRALGVEQRDVRTVSFTVNPQYDLRAPNGRPMITGYTVSNVVTVKVRKVDDLSKVLDAAVAAGGNATRVQQIAFEVGDPQRFEVEARDLAMADAKRRAEQLAKAAGASLGRVRAVSEAVAGGPELLRRLAAPATGASLDSDTPTPVSLGETELRLTVSVVYDLDE